MPLSTCDRCIYCPSALQPRIEIYGPAGLRLFVRQIMKMTLTRTAEKYVVHELLHPEDPVTPCEPSAPDGTESTLNIAEPNVLHVSELPGRDIRATPDGLWRAIAHGAGQLSPIVVDAGPILHRGNYYSIDTSQLLIHAQDPCIGYVFTENQGPSRKLVILGDTYDPTPIIPLCINPPPSLLVHEATDSDISFHADPSGKLSRRTPTAVHEKALSRGHSTPHMAGSFAQKINAQKLVLNHIGGR